MAQQLSTELSQRIHPQLTVAFGSPSRIHAGSLVGVVLCRPCECSHSSRELLTTLSCLANITRYRHPPLRLSLPASYLGSTPPHSPTALPPPKFTESQTSAHSLSSHKL